MAKKEKMTFGGSGFGDDDAPAAPAADGAPRTKPAYDRLAIAIDSSTGKILWDQMRPITQGKLKAAILDPDTTARLGAPVAPGAPAPALTADDLALVSLLYDAVGSIAVSLARAQGYTGDQAALLRYSEEEKTALQEPTARVLAKYSAGFKYTDEVMLALALGSITSAKVAALRASTPAGPVLVARPPMGEPL